MPLVNTRKQIDWRASNLVTGTQVKTHSQHNQHTIQEKTYPDTKRVKNIHCTHLDDYRVLYFSFFPYMLAFLCLRYITNSYSCILYILPAQFECQQKLLSEALDSKKIQTTLKIFQIFQANSENYNSRSKGKLNFLN